jgi:hypothetical protein
MKRSTKSNSSGKQSTPVYGILTIQVFSAFDHNLYSSLIMLGRALDLHYDSTINVGGTDNNADHSIPSMGDLRCLDVGQYSIDS